MSSTLESELNNLIGFFKRSTLTFEIRLCKLHFRVTKTSLWRYANLTCYSTTITAAASFTRRDLQHKTSRLPSTSMTTLTLSPSTQRRNIIRHTYLPQEPPDEP